MATLEEIKNEYSKSKTIQKEFAELYKKKSTEHSQFVTLVNDSFVDAAKFMADTVIGILTHKIKHTLETLDCSQAVPASFSIYYNYSLSETKPGLFIQTCDQLDAFVLNEESSATEKKLCYRVNPHIFTFPTFSFNVSQETILDIIHGYFKSFIEARGIITEPNTDSFLTDPAQTLQHCATVNFPVNF